MTLETLPSSVRRLRFNFEFARECTKEKTLRSAVLVCPFEELKVEGRSGEECWYSISPHFNSLRALVMRKPGTVKNSERRPRLGVPAPEKRDGRHRLVLATPATPWSSANEPMQLVWQTHAPPSNAASTQTEDPDTVHLPRYSLSSAFDAHHVSYSTIFS